MLAFLLVLFFASVSVASEVPVCPVGSLDSCAGSSSSAIAVGGSGANPCTGGSRYLNGHREYCVKDSRGRWNPSGKSALADYDGDGFYDYIRMPIDFDGDGTSWKTCVCGTATEPDWDEQWICGTYRASATDATATDWSAGDSADNPEWCRFNGERVWDDMTDDWAAVEPRISQGADIEVEQGIYPLQSSTPADTSLCWDSGSESFTQTCAVDSTGRNTSAVLIRKSGVKVRGPGPDGNGEMNLKREGAWMLQVRGIREDFVDLAGGTTIRPNFCVGWMRGAGDCGGSIVETGAAADILLNVERGWCADSNADGTCDNGSVKSNIDIDTGNVLCVDDSGGFATGMDVGKVYPLTMRNLGGGIYRQLIRVDAIGSACGSGSEGLSVTFGSVQALNDFNDLSYPTQLVYNVYGSQSSDTAEAAANANLNDAIIPDKWTEGVEISGLTLSHHHYYGDGVCTGPLDSDCDNGSMISFESGSNHVFRDNAVVHSNTAFGSGGGVNFAPYTLGAIVEKNFFGHNVGAGLIDLSNTVMFRDNLVYQNTALNDVSLNESDVNAGYLIRQQGYGWKILNNRFEQNYLPYEYTAQGIVELNVSHGWIEGNTFAGTNANSVIINPGVTDVTIRANEFYGGAFVDNGGSDDDEFGFDIKMVGSEDAPIENIDITGNRFFGCTRYTGSADAGEAIGAICIQLHSGADTTLGDIGINGIHIRDNFFQMKGVSAAGCTTGAESSCNSAIVGVRGCQDPDNARVHLDGNFANTGRVGLCLGMPAGGVNFDLDGTAGGGTADDGIGLLSCGKNRIGGVWYGARIAAEGGRSNASECAAAY